MGTSSAGCLYLLVILCTLPGQETKFINFKNGYEYVYRYEGHTTIKDLGKFIVKAKVSTCIITGFLNYVLMHWESWVI